jgi:hypothetical protein
LKTIAKDINKQNNTLRRYNVPMDGPSAVQLFVKGIQRPEYQPIKNFIVSNLDVKIDLQRAIEAFNEQMTSIYNYPRDQNKKNKDFWRIGSAATGEGKRQKNNNDTSVSHRSSHSPNVPPGPRRANQSQGTVLSNNNLKVPDPLYIPPKVLTD